MKPQGHTPQVFISATTEDLGSYRRAVSDELLIAGIMPVSQDNFGPDYRDLTDFIRDKIRQCDAVICLVGLVYGSAPHSNEDKPRSYTQMEYDLAIEYKKPVFVFLTDDNYRPDRLTREPNKQQELQREYRKFLMVSQYKWDIFSDILGLRLKIAQATNVLRTNKGSLSMLYLHGPEKPSYFVGRLEESKQVSTALSRTSPAIIVIAGMGGQGKTTLVHRVLLEMELFPFAAGFWCTAGLGGFTFDMFLDEVLAYLMQGDFDKRSMPSIGERVIRTVAILQERPVLIVIDAIERWLHAWNSDLRDMSTANTIHDRTAFYMGLDDFISQFSGFNNGTHLVITTRALPAVLDFAAHTNIPVSTENEEEFLLGGLGPEESVELLRSLGVTGTNEECLHVAELYAYHPLALTILAGLLKKKYAGNINYLSLITPMDPKHRLLQLFDEIRNNLPGHGRAESFLAVASLCLYNRRGYA